MDAICASDAGSLERPARFFLGSDDFPLEAKTRATRDLNSALEAGWPGFEIAERIPLTEIALAHERVEHPIKPGRVVVLI